MNCCTEEELLAAVDAYKNFDKNKTHAAASLNLSRSAFRDRLSRAAQLGLCGTDPVMPGFGIKSVSTQLGPEGETQKEWIKQARIGEEQFTLPDGHVIKGVSALVDSSGSVIQQWVKTRYDQAVTDVTAALRGAFSEYEGHATVPDAPLKVDADHATIYPVGDHHLGLYTWKPQVGENYDLNIGKKLLMDTMSSLVASAPNSKLGIILNLGDFFHSDNDTNRTPQSGHVLDVDGRYAKILRVGVDLLIHCTQLALQKHEQVVVRCLPGNHDPVTSLALAIALGAFFHNSPRVRVDDDASAFFKMRFGKVLLTAAHGDTIKHTEMPSFVAATWPQDWGATEFRYCYLGHVHHRSVGGGERAGMQWETFQILAPKDVWHKNSGYTSGRSMVSITHHKDHGEVMRHTVSVRGP